MTWPVVPTTAHEGKDCHAGAGGLRAGADREGAPAGREQSGLCGGHAVGEAAPEALVAAVGQEVTLRTASRIRSATFLGWASMTRWEESTSTVVMPARS